MRGVCKPSVSRSPSWLGLGALLRRLPRTFGWTALLRVIDHPPPLRRAGPVAFVARPDTDHQNKRFFMPASRPVYPPAPSRCSVRRNRLRPGGRSKNQKNVARIIGEQRKAVMPIHNLMIFEPVYSLNLDEDAERSIITSVDAGGQAVVRLLTERLDALLGAGAVLTTLVEQSSNPAAAMESTGPLAPVAIDLGRAGSRAAPRPAACDAHAAYNARSQRAKLGVAHRLVDHAHAACAARAKLADAVQGAAIVGAVGARLHHQGARQAEARGHRAVGRNPGAGLHAERGRGRGIAPIVEMHMRVAGALGGPEARRGGRVGLGPGSSCGLQASVTLRATQIASSSPARSMESTRLPSTRQRRPPPTISTSDRAARSDVIPCAWSARSSDGTVAPKRAAVPRTRQGPGHGHAALARMRLVAAIARRYPNSCELVHNLLRDVAAASSARTPAANKDQGR